MPSSSVELDLLPLSYISQWGYCPRRAGLMAVDQLWADNVYTAEGTRDHQRTHTPRTERRGDFISLYEAPVVSTRLGLNGFCDCVEARRLQEESSSCGARLPEEEGLWQLYPVEYKHGAVRPGETEYHLQLCAQALCLEEMYGGQVPRGAIFYIQDHRRDEIELTPALRAQTEQAARELRQMVASGHVVPAESGAKCRKCSLRDLCLPDVNVSAQAYLKRMRAALREDGI